MEGMGLGRNLKKRIESIIVDNYQLCLAILESQKED